jgi:hypothetical protein
MLNLWIGLCRGAAGLPKTLRGLGYADQSIECAFKNQDLRSVCPDLIVASERAGHTILLEWKSGVTTDADQFQRYSRVTKENLEQRAAIPVAAAHKHDVAILGQAMHAAALTAAIGSYSFPLLIRDEAGMMLSAKTFKVADVTALFTPRLLIDWTKVPTGFVPMDDSSHSWEVAEVVMPKVVEYLARRAPLVRLEQLCHDSCPTWGQMGKEPKEAIRKKVREVLAAAAEREFRDHLRWAGSRSAVEVKSNPLDISGDKRSAAYRKLLLAQKRLIDRLRTGTAPAEQVTLDFEPP